MRPKQGARAEIRHTLIKKVKDKPEIVRQRRMSVKIPSATELIGDGHANVSRTRTIKLAVPDTFGTSISASCTVALTCNQDDKTINKTATLCNRIIDTLVESDQEEMADFVKAMTP